MTPLSSPPATPPGPPRPPPWESRKPAARTNPAVHALAIVLIVMMGVALAAAVLVPFYLRLRHPDPTQQSLVQARRIYNACQAFAAVRGRLPFNLEELVPDFLSDTRALADPGHPEGGEIGYLYYGSGSTGTEAPQTLFLAAKVPDEHDRRAAVQWDGKARVQFLPEKTLPK